MSSGPARLGWLLVALGACASTPATRRTRVDREERVVADSTERSRWFATLFSLQRQLATADARSLDVLGPLQVMLCHPADGSLSRLAGEAQARLAHVGVVPGRVRLRRTLDTELALARWIEASTTAAGAAVERTALLAVEQSLAVDQVTPAGAQAVTLPTTTAPVPEPRCEPGVPEGSQGADGVAVLTQLAVVLRRSTAQALMFQRSLRLAGELRALLPTVAAGASPTLAAEFRAADQVLTGVTARATMHLHESARTEQWAQALLTPEGEGPPDVAPEGTPEGTPDALPEEVFPSAR